VRSVRAVVSITIFISINYRRPLKITIACGPQTGILGAVMDVLKVLADLRVYLAQLDDVISALDGLARRRGDKRGPTLGIANHRTKKLALAKPGKPGSRSEN